MRKINQKYYTPLGLFLIGATLLVYSFCKPTSYYSTNKNDYISLKIKVRGSYRIVHKTKGPDKIKLDFDIISDLEKYPENFFLDMSFNYEDSKISSPLMRNVNPGDTLAVGVSKADFWEIQGYGSNFIKDDFYSRTLQAIWIDSKKATLVSPRKNNKEKNDSNILIALGVVLLFIAITKIVEVKRDNVKFFT